MTYNKYIRLTKQRIIVIIVVEVRKEMLNFDDLEAAMSDDTPANIAKDSIEVHLNIIT